MKGNFLVLILGAVLTFTTACGQYATSTLGLKAFESESSLNDTPEFQKIQAQVDAVELESFKIESEIARLSNLSPQKLKLDPLKDLVKNFKAYIETVQRMIADLRFQIQNQLSTLDPNNPAHQQLIQQLKKALDMLDQLEQHLKSITDVVKTLVDQLFLKIQKYIDQVDSVPAKIVLKLLLEALKNEVIKKLPSI